MDKYYFSKDNKLFRFLFIFIFNITSLFFLSKNKIYFKKNYYYNTEKNWRFFHKKQGLISYVRGFKQRRDSLISVYLLKNLEFDDDDYIIDIGANNGDFYLCFNKKIKYFGYEPSPIVFSNLEYNIKNQNLYNIGLSDLGSKNIEFYLSDEFGNSSILPIKEYTNKININTTTLDLIISKIQKKIKLIKVEAEGFEPEILNGLKKYISYVEYITVDCGFERGIKQSSTIAECSNYLISRNFKMIDFDSSRIVCLFKNLNVKVNQ
ncbi:FkbM family methyltransferase [Pelagibacteraceae bacterium]|nr:FkbM family methyltransferase [Pelagibacteraceae bacterium]